MDPSQLPTHHPVNKQIRDLANSEQGPREIYERYHKPNPLDGTASFVFGCIKLGAGLLATIVVLSMIRNCCGKVYGYERKPQVQEAGIDISRENQYYGPACGQDFYDKNRIPENLYNYLTSHDKLRTQYYGSVFFLPERVK